MSSKFFNPEQYVLSRVEAYPSLYAASSFEAASFKVFDQLFNTIGNGIRDQEELEEDLTVYPVDFEHARKFLTEEKIFYGSYKVKDYGDGFVMPIHSDNDPCVLESEKVKYPNVAYWYEARITDDRSPYPNFSKKYSIVWRSNFDDFGQDWTDAAGNFYEECRRYFEGDCSTYSSAYPRESAAETDQTRKSYQSRMKNKTPSEIEEGYGVSFDGDIDKFISARWFNERARILSFIDETINMLKK